MKTLRSISLAAALAATLAAPAAFAGAVHDAGLFTTVLARNDDGSTGSVGIGFSIDFYGLSAQSTLFVNNNGNVTFTGPLSTFTPFGLLTSTIPIIAPFFADVDTRNLGSDVVRYGTGSIGGRSVFGVNWIDVGYFGSHADKLNSFQLIITPARTSPRATSTLSSTTTRSSGKRATPAAARAVSAAARRAPAGPMAAPPTMSLSAPASPGLSLTPARAR